MEDDRNTPGPEGPGTRRVIAWVLILALAGLPLSYLVGTAGGEIAAVLLVAGLLVGGTAFLLHRRSRADRD